MKIHISDKILFNSLLEFAISDALHAMLNEVGYTPLHAIISDDVLASSRFQRECIDYSRKGIQECDRVIHEPQDDQSEDVKNTPHMRDIPDRGTDRPNRELVMRKMGELCWHFLMGQDPLAVLIRNLIKEEEKIPDEVPYRTPLADWLDGSDVMRALHISPRTLQTLRSNGTLLYSQIGGKIYYKKEVLEELLERNYAINQSGKEGAYGK